MEKQRWEEPHKRNWDRKKIREEKSQKKDTGARKGRKVAKHCVFPNVLWLRRVKVGSLKRRVRSHLGRWEMKKLHAAVVRSKFRSQNVQNTSLPEHFWKLRCRKSACSCGAKHMWKSKVKNWRSQTTFGSKAVGKVHALTAHLEVKSENKVGQRTQKQDGTRRAFFWKSCGVGSCVLCSARNRNIARTNGIKGHNSPQYAVSATSTFF